MVAKAVIEREPRVALEDRYELREGRVFLTGVQALVRVLLDQHRADTRSGLRTAIFVSGYQGSPLGGFDRELDRLGALADEHEIVLRPAVNEELGATAVWGSQLSGTLPGPRYDGVLGVWYGKSPGLDRSADAIRHGNYVGADSRGGMLALCGDDPACKSSTLPSASESLLAALQMPVLAPGSVQELLDLGRHAIACSRASGLWAALKIITNVADATGTVQVGLDRVHPVLPHLDGDGAPYVHRPSAHLLAPESLEMERTLVEVRLELAKRYAQLNRLNRVVHDSPRAWLGIVAAGATAHELQRALVELGFGDGAPVRVLQLGMLFPFDRDAVREFADGLDEVLVLEEKGPFLEPLVRDALYGGAHTPRVIGKRDERDAPVVPAHGTLAVDEIAQIVAQRLLARDELPAVRELLERLEMIAGRPAIDVKAVRTPAFCSGCPHNTSTVVTETATVGAGIGCHTMIMLDQQRHGKTSGLTQMGGEGAQWIGAAPFCAVPHFVQNLGDGTFHHSGSLAVRAAVAAGLNVTYKLLFNGYVAMTGGQHVQGHMSVPEVALSLAAEGVRRIVITTDNPTQYLDAGLPEIAQVRARGEIMSAQAELAQVPGVTILLHDQLCAAELRRERKRGRATDPPERVMINERVCEGCGDCGEKSGCLSVEPIDTEFGRKTRINQTGCNKDYSCLAGDCPSFITVIPHSDGEARVDPRLPETDLPEPDRCTATDVRVRLVGIGGTGVVTVSQVLGMAALLDGRHASGLDQTGLSQKAGPVVSDLRVSTAPIEEGVSVPSGSVDVLLAFDLLGAAAPHNLRVADPQRTIAVVSNSIVPTARMVVDVDAPAPDTAAVRAAIDAATCAQDYLDAQLIAERLLGDATPANVVVLGAALQRGLLPVSLASLQEAFRLNGVAVERNLAALAWGRAWVLAPDTVTAALGNRVPTPPQSAQTRELVNRLRSGEGELRRLLEVRVPDLIGWGGKRVTVEYVNAIARVQAVETERLPGSTGLTEAVARGLYKLMAYKDEYEVARLHLEELDTLPRDTKVKLHLHPPLLRALGLKRKLKLGRWFIPVLRLLRHARVLRGTPFDPFGYDHVRRIERSLPGEYLNLVEDTLATLRPDTYELALEMATLPEVVRGYEQIKLAGVQRFRDRAADLRQQLVAKAGS